jgi:transposase
MGKANRFSPEVRERAVRLVGEQADEKESQWATIRSVAAKIGCSAETLRSWIRQTERDRGERSGLTTSEREELKALQRENRELKKANEILRLASAYFAKAELDRKQRYFYTTTLTGTQPWPSLSVLFSCFTSLWLGIRVLGHGGPRLLPSVAMSTSSTSHRGLIKARLRVVRVVGESYNWPQKVLG